MSRTAALAPITYHDVMSDDGTMLRAWTNDPDGAIDGPTVLLCNGLGTNPWVWPALLDPDCDVRVVSWNHRGTGGSERPVDPNAVTIDHFAADAVSVMDHFGVDQCVVMGWSMGVNTMFELAAIHPERVSGLFAVAGVPGDTLRTMLAPLHLPTPVAKTAMIVSIRTCMVLGRAATPITRRVPVTSSMVRLASRVGLVFEMPDPELAAVAAREFLSTPVDWYARLALYSARHPRVSLRRIKVPVEFVSGSRDIFAGARHLATAAARVPDATHVELNGSHFLCLEQPERVHQLLVDFIARVNESASAH